MSDPILSFCIPVMDRLADLQQTLAQNLEDNRSSIGRAEFVVVCFDEDDATEQWVHEQFEADLQCGYLRFVRAAPLPFWHFGRAKNAFRGIMRGKIYASLDGDNFTGPNAAEHIIAVFEALEYRCVFHQFQGTWGDGTSGRVALPRADYERRGYDERLLPRQWDEMDAMLSVLARHPDYFYACYRGKGIIQKSPHFRRFFDDHGRTPRVHEIDADSDPAKAIAGSVSTAQHGKGYVRNDPLLIEFSNFNQYQSFFNNTDQDELRTRYAGKLVSIQQKLVRVADPGSLLMWVLEAQNEMPASTIEGGVTVLACLKDEPDPESWYQHYRDLGARRFLLVDDDSAQPLADVLEHDDVHIWKPRVGHFRHAKTLWLETLLARFCLNQWCLTVDSDEFISLPMFEHGPDDSRSPLDTLTGLADQKRCEYFCGFLLDLHPETGSSVTERQHYNHYIYREQPPDEGYLHAPAVKWSYAGCASWAFSLDLRYRLNQTIDSLRKFPCFRYTRETHLNQGFHDLIINGKPRSARELQRADLLPILHYKLWSLREKNRKDSEVQPPGQASDFSAYHPRTRDNLTRLAANLENHLDQAAAFTDSFRFLAYSLIPVPGAATIRVYRMPITVDNRERLERRGGFYFQQVSGQISVHGCALSGPDFERVIAWLREKTPYRLVENEQADGVTLRAQPDPGRKPAGKGWFKWGWLSGNP